MPSTAKPPVAEPDPLRSFAVYPRRVAIEGSGEAQVIVVVPTPGSESALVRLRTDAVGACRAGLGRVREEFFRTGQGQELRVREAKLAAAERAVRDTTAAVEKLRDQWRIAVAADGTDDVVGLENQIGEQEKVLDRLKVRVPVLLEEFAKARRELSAELFQLLQTARAEFEERAARELAAVLARMAEAVNAVYADWLRIGLEHGGSKMDVPTMRLLASVDQAVPSARDHECLPPSD